MTIFVSSANPVIETISVWIVDFVGDQFERNSEIINPAPCPMK